MRVLILGSGGREHTFARALTKSPLCSNLFTAPGNSGTASLGKNVAIDINDFSAVGNLVLTEKIDLLIVGPEAPLVKGLKNYFEAHEDLKNVLFVGPDKQGAQMEGSKAFAKSFMQEFQIPTAQYQAFDQSNKQAGIDYLKNHDLPVVLKADGLAAGKGVLILDNHNEAISAFEAMLDGKFGDAGSVVVIEQFLSGLEFSVFVLSDGAHYKILPVAKDYKRIGEGDTGLNTGGMGAISPPPFVDETLMQKVEERVIKPTVQGLISRKIDYRGFIFIGLIEVNGEPFVIEYNCRMGDPETQVVLPRLQTDLVELMQATAKGELASVQIETDEKAAATVVMVSGGYPVAYEKGKKISGLESVSNAEVVHAGMKMENDSLLTNGGRVLSVTGRGVTLAQALEQAYHGVDLVDFADKNYRKDIGFDVEL